MMLAVIGAGHPNHIIYSRDSFGKTPMDYLCLNRNPTSTDTIRRVLQARFNYLLGLDRSWNSELLQAVEKALSAEFSSRMREIFATYLKLAKHEQQEILSIMEICLWKMKIDKVNTNEQTADREFCRVNSGASIVIPHVLAFLDKIDAEAYF
eukprot:scaffold10216_cov88-Cylindrotheca_fusiformis.AAC.1